MPRHEEKSMVGGIWATPSPLHIREKTEPPAEIKKSADRNDTGYLDKFTSRFIRMPASVPNLRIVHS